MKKLFLLFLALSLLSVIYASNPKITVVPKECLINNSVYVIYQWEVPYAVEDFRVTVYSDAVDFENSMILYEGIAKDAEIFHIFKGKAIKPGNHTIKVYMKYMSDGAYIKKKFAFNISILPKIQYVEKVKVVEKIIEKNVTSTNTNKTSVEVANNKTNITTTPPIIKKDEDKTENTNNIKKTESSGSSQKNIPPEINDELNGMFVDVLYGIAGLVLGVVFGFVTMYVIRM